MPGGGLPNLTFKNNTMFTADITKNIMKVYSIHKNVYTIRIHLIYQNLTYRAAIIRSVSTTNTVVCGVNLNIVLSNSNALGFIFGPPKLIAIIRIIVNMNDNPIQMWNGISNPPFPFGYAVYKNVLFPNNEGANSLNKTDNRNPVITPAMAAQPVVLFQNIPRKNIAKTPGLIKPVYF